MSAHDSLRDSLALAARLTPLMQSAQQRRRFGASAHARVGRSR